MVFSSAADVSTARAGMALAGARIRVVQTTVAAVRRLNRLDMVLPGVRGDEAVPRGAWRITPITAP